MVLVCGISASVVNEKSKVIARGRTVASPRQQVQHGSVSNNSGQMADGIERQEENKKARKHLKKRGEAMLGRINKKTLDTFDEEQGSSGYARWRQQIATGYAFST